MQFFIKARCIYLRSLRSSLPSLTIEYDTSFFFYLFFCFFHYNRNSINYLFNGGFSKFNLDWLYSRVLVDSILRWPDSFVLYIDSKIKKNKNPKNYSEIVQVISKTSTQYDLWLEFPFDFNIFGIKFISTFLR